MIDYWSLIVLGSVAGFTIFLGLPIAFLQHLSLNQKGFLTAFALGILIFLTIDVFSHSWEATEDIVKDAFVGDTSWMDATIALVVFLGGVSVGLLGLAIYERKAITTRVPNILTLENIKKGDDHLLQTFNKINAYRLAMMISIGIGAHNFSEGLAIGQSYISGEIALAILLIVGFGIHNATEGFGIAGPLTGLIKRPSVKFLFLLGIIGGGPTFLGTLLGGFWISDFAYILFLSAAGGSLIYVSLLMYNTGRKQTTNVVMMFGILIGLCAGFLTDLIVAIGKA